MMLNAVRSIADKRGVMISKLPPETLRRFGIVAKTVRGEYRSCTGYDVKIPKKFPDLCPPELWMVVRHIESYGMGGAPANPVPKKRGRKKEPLDEPLEGESPPSEMAGRDVEKMLGR